MQKPGLQNYLRVRKLTLCLLLTFLRILSKWMYIYSFDNARKVQEDFHMLQYIVAPNLCGFFLKKNCIVDNKTTAYPNILLKNLV